MDLSKMKARRKNSKRAKMQKAHICLIWALLIIWGWIVAIFVKVILQNKCIGEIGNSSQLSAPDLHIPTQNTLLAVDFGGAC